MTIVHSEKKSCFMEMRPGLYIIEILKRSHSKHRPKRTQSPIFLVVFGWFLWNRALAKRQYWMNSYEVGLEGRAPFLKKEPVYRDAHMQRCCAPGFFDLSQGDLSESQKGAASGARCHRMASCKLGGPSSPCKTLHSYRDRLVWLTVGWPVLAGVFCSVSPVQ